MDWETVLKEAQRLEELRCTPHNVSAYHIAKTKVDYARGALRDIRDRPTIDKSVQRSAKKRKRMQHARGEETKAMKHMLKEATREYAEAVVTLRYGS